MSQIKLFPKINTIPYNFADGYKNVIFVDECISDEITKLWNNNIITTGCCCGHGKIGFIQVSEQSIDKMKKLGYEKYIYSDDFGGINRNDAFIPKTKCRCEVEQ